MSDDNARHSCGGDFRCQGCGWITCGDSTDNCAVDSHLCDGCYFIEDPEGVA